MSDKDSYQTAFEAVNRVTLHYRWLSPELKRDKNIIIAAILAAFQHKDSMRWLQNEIPDTIVKELRDHLPKIVYTTTDWLFNHAKMVVNALNQIAAQDMHVDLSQHRNLTTPKHAVDEPPKIQRL